MIELFDTHCHIHSIDEEEGEVHTAKLWSKQPGSLEQIVTNAHEQGVNRLITIGCDLKDSQLAIKAANKLDKVWASIGIHPHEASGYANEADKLAKFSDLVTQPKVVAIGECGLDFFYNHSDKASQIKILEFQLKLAHKHKLPVIFHVRDAFDSFWQIFDRIKPSKGVLHSFTDSEENLGRALQRGLYIGVNGIATFTKEHQQTAMYKNLPLAHLVLETDAPFLTPSPLRGNINEPKNVRLVLEYLARLRGESVEAIASQTTANARELFKV